MNAVDIWAAIAASAACGAVAARAHMLKPHQRAWAPAPAPVWISLAVLGVILGMAAWSLWTGAHATWREATVYTALAASALIMLRNLDRHGRREDLAAQLHGKAGLVMTVETRDPAALEAFARGERRRKAPS